MIFVITGSEAFPFNRLIETIDLLKKDDVIKQDVFVQLGSCTYYPSYCRWEQWIPFDKMRENINSSDLVISHAGAGTTLLCLEMGKAPLIVARRKKYGEHLDDHQLEFAEMMDNLNYAIVAYDAAELPGILMNLDQTKTKILKESMQKEKLIKVLNKWFETV